MLQAKFFCMLQASQVVPVGSQKVFHVDIRLIDATSHDLRERINVAINPSLMTEGKVTLGFLPHFLDGAADSFGR